MPRSFVCRSEELLEGKGRSVKLLPGTEAYIFRLHGQVKAFINRCTHMGGPVELTADTTKLCCRRHEATFNPETGERIGGQAPEGSALTTLATEEDASGVWLQWSLPQDLFSL